MWKATLKGLAAHKLRLALTALAIVLGVSFVAGTYVLTDTINRTFNDLFTQVTKGVDVAVRTKATFSAQGNEQRAPMPALLLDRVKAVPGVKAAEGSVSGYAQFIGKNGKPVTTGGAPTLGVSLSTTPELQAATTVRAGRLPSGPGEVAVDAHTASKQGFHVGDRVKLLFQGPPGEYTVSGILGFGQADNLAGATLAGFDLATAQQVLHREGVYDEIDVVAAPGVSDTQLRDRVKAALDPTYEVLTGEQFAQDTAKAVGQFTKFINYALLAFAFVALFVGSFIIVNTFSIILAQRTRELALLRCLGASRRQVLVSVLTEAFITGVLASVVGLGLGVLVAAGLKQVFKAIGADLPSTTLEILPRTIVVALLVGVVVTLVASLVPALKATRVPPVAALQEEAAAAPAHTSRRRTVLGTLVTAVGVALLLAGLFAKQGNRLASVASGAVVVFLGVGILSPLVARPLARVLGWPFAHWTGEPGKLARENAMRSPRRTASTAAALMIGLALVSFVTIFAASLKASVTKILDQAVAADYILSGPSNSGQGFSTEVVTRLAQQPEVDSAAGVRFGVFKLDGKTEQLFGVDPVAYDKTVRTDTTAGSLADLAGGGVAVRKDVARQHGWKVGDSIAMEFPVGGTRQEPIKAIYEDNQLNGAYLLAMPDFERHYADQLDALALVKAGSGVSPDASRAAVDRVVTDFPNVQVKDQAEYKQEQASQINRVLLLFYVLLALAVVIAFIGIINTLALSVLERVRELGLLRAVGMTRGQLRQMIRWEAVIIAVLGAVLGLVVGTFFGWMLVRSLRGQGVTEFALPVGTLLAFVAAAAIAGVLAAVFPGRRAARIDMLRAITTE
ncbi:MAG TPA: FtsX-like permease family protein [Actinomycetes bacterium]|nr:FtsX-like permease family protein [Actinomycetes bacterium]